MAGFIERQKEKAHQRLRAAVEPLLETGESIRVAFPATSRIRWFLAMLGAFPAAFYLELTGRGRLVPWMLGLYMGVSLALTMRTFFVVLTDRGLRVLRLKRMSSKTIERGAIYAPSEVSVLSFDGSGLHGRLKLEVEDLKLDLQVARPFKDQASVLVEQTRGGNIS